MTAQPSALARPLVAPDEIVPLTNHDDRIGEREYLAPTQPQLGGVRSQWSELPGAHTGETDNAAEVEGEETRVAEPAPETPRPGMGDDPLRVYLQQMGPLP